MKFTLLFLLFSIFVQTSVTRRNRKCRPSNPEFRKSNVSASDTTVFDKAFGRNQNGVRGDEEGKGIFTTHDVKRVIPSGCTLLQEKEIKFNGTPSIEIKPPGYVGRNQTKILIHGFTENRNAETMKLIRNAYLRHTASQPLNVIVVDWGPLAEGVYFNNLPNIKPVGKYVSEFIQALDHTHPSNVHLIGFSLGAQVAGAAGLHYFQNYGSKIGRITGLDPAGPGFEAQYINSKLDRGDAQFVDVIHTSRTFGSEEVIGTAEFFVNGGRDQPGCGILDILGACDHLRAPRYFAESLAKVTNACPCKDWKTYLSQCKKSKECSKNSVRFGALCPTTARGTYYLELKLG